MKAIQILFAAGSNVGYKSLRRDTAFFSRDHDGRAMRIVSTDKMHLMPAHAHEAYPDIGLDIFHDVADMEGTVCVGQGGGDKKGAAGLGFGDAHCLKGRVGKPRFYQCCL